MPSQCVDGHRKPPKYLNDERTKKAAKAKCYDDLTCLGEAETLNQQENTSNPTSNELVWFPFRGVLLTY
jgi:hypothetical protein